MMKIEVNIAGAVSNLVNALRFDIEDLFLLDGISNDNNGKVCQFLRSAARTTS